jgi:hypothetical protein
MQFVGSTPHTCVKSVCIPVLLQHCQIRIPAQVGKTEAGYHLTMTETSGITRISQYSERICHCLLPLLPLPQNQVGKAADLVAVDLGSIEAPSTQLSSYIFRWLFRHISTISMYSNDFDIFRLHAV